MTISYVSATSTENFINSIGINTHLDFTSYSSQISTVEADINYLGVKNIRDSAESSSDLGTSGLWQKVANATGAKFDAYAAEGSVATMQASFNNALTLAGQGIIKYIEGGNEEDQSYSESLGNSLATTAAFQQTVYAKAHALGISVINMSFGTGWSTSSTGDYGTVGNLAAYTNYANDHVYFGTGNTPLSTIQALNSDAELAATGKPVINTEMGWYTDTGTTTDTSSSSLTEQAKYMLDGLMDAYQAGDAMTYLYELLDEGTNTSYSEDNFGLFYSNGTAKPAATALHNLTTLLADTGTKAATFTPTGLSYQLTGTTSTDHSMLLQKSDGSFWLAVWDEARLSSATTGAAITVANQSITLTLASAAATIEIYDPLTGTTAIQTVSNASTVTLSVPDHPILVEIIPGTSTSTSTSSGSSSSGSTSTTTPTASDLTVVVPTTADMAYTSQTTKLAGVSISDAWAANHAGSMVLNLTAGHNALEITSGATVDTVAAGHTLTLTGSLATLNADLATLEIVGGSTAATDAITVDVWNQGGVESSKTLLVSLQAASGASTTTSTTTTLSASDLAVIVPTVSPTATNTAYAAISGISISDAWGAAHSGSLALNLSVSHGTLEISNGTTELTGATLALTGTLVQLNADLQTLHYEANTAVVGVDTLSVNVWNQGGVSVTHALSLHI